MSARISKIEYKFSKDFKSLQVKMIKIKIEMCASIMFMQLLFLKGPCGNFKSFFLFFKSLPLGKT